MDYLQALILSTVEGLTEFLPISSTGHLILTADLLKIPQTEFLKSFEIIIQLGAILAVVVLYFNTLLKNYHIWIKILLSFIPTAFLGLLFYNIVKTYFLGNSLLVVISLILGGLFLIIFEKYFKPNQKLEKIEQLSTKQALLIGLVQSFSMIPGVSRSAATIIGGMFIGLTRAKALEFSFFLAIPTMFAATSLNLFKSSFNFSAEEYGLLSIGFIGAFVTASIAIKFFIKFVQDHTFIPFGIYRIILGILFWVIFLI